MQPAPLKRALLFVGWVALAVGMGFLAYATYALYVGQVFVASRAMGNATIPASTGWPFAVGIALYLGGAGIFLWIARQLLKFPGS
jgi:hypothetical protein